LPALKLPKSDRLSQESSVTPNESKLPFVPAIARGLPLGTTVMEPGPA
jgi:hypothetical protein